MKRFNFGLAWRLTLLFGCMIGLSAIFWNSDYPFTQLILSSLIISLVVEVIRFVRQTNADLTKFLFALKFEDGSVRFSDRKSGVKFEELRHELERILQKIEQKSLDDNQRQYALSKILDTLPVGLIVLFNEQIHLRNEYAKNLLYAHSGENQLCEWLSNLNLNKNVINYGSNEISVQSASFQSGGQYEVFALTEVSDVGEQRETEAYQKLIRILTHEIMNSVTSISSLSATLLEVGKRQNLEPRLVNALASIKKRSAGMISFVGSYRKITDVPAPSRIWFPLLPLVRELSIPFSEKSHIKISIEGDDAVKVKADRNQISQVIINILLNAQHAIENNKHGEIDIHLKEESKEVKLEFKDNGVGIEPSVLKDIFTPFFSTRETGSGIGLSLSRQIMRNNNGAIGVTSTYGEGAKFVLRFAK